MCDKVRIKRKGEKFIYVSLIRSVLLLKVCISNNMKQWPSAPSIDWACLFSIRIYCVRTFSSRICYESYVIVMLFVFAVCSYCLLFSSFVCLARKKCLSLFVFFSHCFLYLYKNHKYFLSYALHWYYLGNKHKQHDLISFRDTQYFILFITYTSSSNRAISSFSPPSNISWQ